MHTGKIKRLNEKRYGFIKPDNSSDRKDLFFHATGLENAEWEDLREGLPVTYEIESNEKGPRATKVSVSR